MNSNGLRSAGFVLTLLSLLAAVWLGLQGRWFEAGIMAGFVLAAFLFGVWRDWLPSLFTFLFTFAAAMNALGYVLELWKTPFWFDEVVHVITPFTIVAAVAWIMVKRDNAFPLKNPAEYPIKIVLIGLVVGVLWEGLEWAIGIVGTWNDTLVDLLMDGIGASLAALFCWSAARSELSDLSRKLPDDRSALEGAATSAGTRKVMFGGLEGN